MTTERDNLSLNLFKFYFKELGEKVNNLVHKQNSKADELEYTKTVFIKNLVADIIKTNGKSNLYNFHIDLAELNKHLETTLLFIEKTFESTNTNDFINITVDDYSIYLSLEEVKSPSGSSLTSASTNESNENHSYIGVMGIQIDWFSIYLKLKKKFPYIYHDKSGINITNIFSLQKQYKIVSFPLTEIVIKDTVLAAQNENDINLNLANFFTPPKLAKILEVKAILLLLQSKEFWEKYLPLKHFLEHEPEAEVKKIKQRFSFYDMQEFQFDSPEFQEWFQTGKTLTNELNKTICSIYEKYFKYIPIGELPQTDWDLIEQLAKNSSTSAATTSSAATAKTELETIKYNQYHHRFELFTSIRDVHSHLMGFGFQWNVLESLNLSLCMKSLKSTLDINVIGEDSLISLPYLSNKNNILLFFFKNYDFQYKCGINYRVFDDTLKCSLYGYVKDYNGFVNIHVPKLFNKFHI